MKRGTWIAVVFDHRHGSRGLDDGYASTGRRGGYAIEDFFVTSLEGAQGIDIENYTLEVFGLVEESRNFTYEELKSLPQITEKATLRCVTGGTSTGIWTGVKISQVLEATGVQEGAMEVIFYSSDGFSTSLTLEDATRDDVILAYELNNETIPDRLGFPLRVVSPHQYGYKWAMWVVSMEIGRLRLRRFLGAEGMGRRRLHLPGNGLVATRHRFHAGHSDRVFLLSVRARLEEEGQVQVSREVLNTRAAQVHRLPVRGHYDTSVHLLVTADIVVQRESVLHSPRLVRTGGNWLALVERDNWDIC